MSKQRIDLRQGMSQEEKELWEECETYTTVGEIKKDLEGYPDDCYICFAQDMIPYVYYRMKIRAMDDNDEKPELLCCELSDLREMK